MKVQAHDVDLLEHKVNCALLNITLKQAESLQLAGQEGEKAKKLEEARELLRDIKKCLDTIEDEEEREAALNPPDPPDGINLMKECRSLGEQFRDELEPEWSQLFGERR